ncbi:hypothetical protein [Mesorhizobium amorphae]|uniref:hypothetical protein n=1 Tax=Mesorhizobium amorphae TaxID=71433 RepID=UPI001186E4A9|nr:hypothetical protein [Mesorhizobium amorphae]
MNAIAMNIEDELAEELKVVKFPIRQSLNELEQLADVHRREAGVCKQRIADRKRSLKAELANLALARRIAKSRYETEMAQIAEQEADAKSSAAEAIASDEKLVTYNLGAIELLAE